MENTDFSSSSGTLQFGKKITLVHMGLGSLFADPFLTVS